MLHYPFFNILNPLKHAHFSLYKSISIDGCWLFYKRITDIYNEKDILVDRQRDRQTERHTDIHTNTTIYTNTYTLERSHTHTHTHTQTHTQTRALSVH